MCHVLYKPNVIVFPKLARQNFTSQAEFCKPKLLPWQSGEVLELSKIRFANFRMPISAG
jgi:hypothetical protein